MASKTGKERYRPGLLDFGLNAGKPEGNYQLNVCVETTNTLLDAYKGHNATEAALLNLKGALLYYQHKYKDACDVFDQVLDKDDKNLNARKNLEHVYRDLGLWSNADKLKLSAADEKDPKLKAICRAEQAFAIMFDCHVSTDESARFRRSRLLFEKSLKHDSKSEHVLEWKFWYAELLRRSTAVNRTHDILGKGIALLMEVIDDDIPGDMLVFRSTAYTCMGQFLYKAKSIRTFDLNQLEETIIKELSKNTTKEVIQSKLERFKLKERYDNPKDLFNKACKLQKNTEVLTRYALYLKGNNSIDDIREAVNLLEDIDDSKNGNWFSINVRSGLYLKLYKLSQKDEQRPDLITTLSTDGGDTGIDGPPVQTSTPKKETEHAEIPVITHTSSGDIPDCTNESFEISPNRSLLSSGYNTQNESADSSRSASPWLVSECCDNSSYSDSEYLDKAIRDGERAASLNPTCEIYTVLGEAYHIKAKTVQDKNKKDDFYFKALSSFVHALRHLDGKKLPYIHLLHGKCLSGMKQYRPAVESYKRAIECQIKDKKVYEYLMRSYVELLRTVGETRELIREICHWLRFAYVDDASKLTRTLEVSQQDNGDAGISYKDKMSYNHAVAIIVRAMLEQGTSSMGKDKGITDIILKLCLTSEYMETHHSLAVEILSELICMQVMSADYVQYMINSIDDNITEKRGCEKEVCVNVMAKAFVKCRDGCCIEKKSDFKMVNIFKQMHAKCPTFCKEIALAIASDGTDGCMNLATILSHNIGNEDPKFQFKVDESGNHLQTELVYIIRKELNQEKPYLHTCLSKIEEHITVSDDSEKQQPIPESHGDTISDPKVRNKDFDYDFYVIHSEEDREWVTCELLPTLERRYQFKGCLEIRDCIPGRSKFTEIDTHIDKSYRILAILTEAFIKDKFCLYILQQSFNNKLGRDGVIPIRKGKLDNKDIPELLKTTVSVSAVETSDWERIVRALDARP